RVIEHDGSGMEITAIAEPFSRPDGTHDMRMPMFTSITVDDMAQGVIEGLLSIYRTKLRQKDMVFVGRMCDSGEKDRTPDREVLFQERHEWTRERKVKDIGSALFRRNFELGITKREMPVPLRVFVEIVS